jgi:hypothetical protein
MTKALLLVLLFVPQLAVARMYMCVDPATGATSFTDKACETKTSREEVRVGSTNLDSGSGSGRKTSSKTWNSQREGRKTGVDVNNQRRELYENKASASNDPVN